MCAFCHQAPSKQFTFNPRISYPVGGEEYGTDLLDDRCGDGCFGCWGGGFCGPWFQGSVDAGSSGGLAMIAGWLSLAWGAFSWR